MIDFGPDRNDIATVRQYTVQNAVTDRNNDDLVEWNEFQQASKIENIRRTLLRVR